MAYKIKNFKKIPKNYFEERELANVRKKYKGKVPPFRVLAREGTREAFAIQESVHTKGEFVQYRGELGRVEKVEKTGIWLNLFKKDNKGIINNARTERVFVKEKDVEAGKVYPYYSKLPMIFGNMPISFEKV
jgi:hypothetical protein